MFARLLLCAGHSAKYIIQILIYSLQKPSKGRQFKYPYFTEKSLVLCQNQDLNSESVSPNAMILVIKLYCFYQLPVISSYEILPSDLGKRSSMVKKYWGETLHQKVNLVPDFRNSLSFQDANATYEPSREDIECNIF